MTASSSVDTAAILREVVERLAPLERAPCSPGEREAAEWLTARLEAAGCEVALEDEPSWGSFPPTVLGLALTGLGACVLSLAGRRGPATVLAGGTVLGLLDEIHNGPRWLRRAVRRKRKTANVVARAGDQRALKTLLVLAHHDAAQTGFFFDQTLQRKAWELFPDYIGPKRTPPPQWWAGVIGPALAVLTALSGRRRPARIGLAIQLAGVSIMADMARSPVVPGANDNLSACAVLVALAERLREQPVEGLRVLLVSAGAEETLQDGIRAFVSRHAGELPEGRTVVLNLDTIGSPELGLLEAEGPVWMEEYAGGEWRDRVVAVAEREGVALERGFRARASTDGIITSRYGLPTATLISVTPWRSLANYHLMSDTPENLDWDTVGEAARLSEALVRDLAASA